MAKRAASRMYASRDRERGEDEMYARVGSATNVALNPDVSIKLRGITPDDVNFIIDSWADSYRHSQDMRDVDPDLYKIEMRARIYSLIPKAKWVIACEPRNERNIRGWICYMPPAPTASLPVVHYMLVKPELQNRGICTAMLDVVKASAATADSPVFVTHRTFPIVKWFAAKRNLIFNPFLAGK
jgi:hypothetical protein